MNISKNTLVKSKFIICIIAVSYIIGISRLVRHIGIDSDKANHVLQANDILDGNVFFDDWILTGVTFLTTDLPFYELALLIVGEVDYKVVYLAGGLMISSMVMLAIYTSLYEKKLPLWYLLPLLALFMIPSHSFMVYARVHAGAVVVSVISIILVYRYLMVRCKMNLNS